MRMMIRLHYKRLLTVVFVLAVALSCIGPVGVTEKAHAIVKNGEYYEINTPEELLQMKAMIEGQNIPGDNIINGTSYADAKFRLMKDIDMGPAYNTGIEPITTQFSGTFDGGRS